MCGICGYVSKESLGKKLLKQMNDQMSYRGPDDSGEEVFTDKGFEIGMAQRRLSIQDLSHSGHQPMWSKDQSICVVFNGEIYNFLELKAELKDYEYISVCDTEIIIAYYLKYGIRCIDKFNGMFSIAIYDQKIHSLFLIRDRIGKKPLYYYYDKGNLIFASELKPIMQYPYFDKSINRDIIKQYLYHGYINGKNSVFSKVSKVAAGTYVEFNCNERKEYVYWDIKKIYEEASQKKVTDYQEAKNKLTLLLEHSVAQRLIADVSVGAFLSGGYDSSLITALAQKQRKEPLKTFSIGFNNKTFDEAIYAKQIAEYLGTEHTEYYISEQDMLELVESLTFYYDEPFADSSQIPMMLVSRLAKQDVSVVLSGDGGDEFFCGYDIYMNARKAQHLDIVGQILYLILHFPGIPSQKIINSLPTRLQSIIMNRDYHKKVQFSGVHNKQLCNRMIANNSNIVFQEEADLISIKNWQIRRMLLDMKTYLPDDILCKVDRATMRYALEARCPILDKDVMEFSFRIPHQFKYYRGTRKRVLKDIAYSYIPKELLERPKKGFSVPLVDWLKTSLKECLLENTDSTFLKNQGIFQPEETRKIVMDFLQNKDRQPQNTANILWHLLVFQKWYKKYIL